MSAEVQTADVRACKAAWARAIARRQFARSLPELDAYWVLLSAEDDAALARLLMARLGITR